MEAKKHTPLYGIYKKLVTDTTKVVWIEKNEVVPIMQILITIAGAVTLIWDTVDFK